MSYSSCFGSKDLPIFSLLHNTYYILVFSISYYLVLIYWYLFIHMPGLTIGHYRSHDIHYQRSSKVGIQFLPR